MDDVQPVKKNHTRSIFMLARSIFMLAHAATSRIAALPVTTKHGPWEGTNNGHPTMILTGMTHGDYQPALHPPPSDLGKIGTTSAQWQPQSL